MTTTATTTWAISSRVRHGRYESERDDTRAHPHEAVNEVEQGCQERDTLGRYYLRYHIRSDTTTLSAPRPCTEQFGACARGAQEEDTSTTHERSQNRPQHGRHCTMQNGAGANADNRHRISLRSNDHDVVVTRNSVRCRAKGSHNHGRRHSPGSSGNRSLGAVGAIPELDRRRTHGYRFVTTYAFGRRRSRSSTSGRWERTERLPVSKRGEEDIVPLEYD